jgi:hypothetical protein
MTEIGTMDGKIFAIFGEEKALARPSMCKNEQ